MPEGRISQSLPGPLGRWLPATPEIALSALALTAWVAPEAFGHALIKALTLALLGEFILLGADFFIGRAGHGASRREVLVRTLWVLAFIAPAPVLLMQRLGDWWPLLALGLLAATRVAAVWSRPAIDPDAHGDQEAFVVCCLGAWFGLNLLLSVFAADWVPTLGLPPGIGQEIWGPGIGGLWPEQPQVPLATACLYFGLKAIWCVHGTPALVRKIGRGGRWSRR